MVGIKDWEIPERCGDCCFCDWIMGHGGEWAYYCIVPNRINYNRINYIGKYTDIEKPNKPSFCPLVEIEEKEK